MKKVALVIKIKSQKNLTFCWISKKTSFLYKNWKAPSSYEDGAPPPDATVIIRECFRSPPPCSGNPDCSQCPGTLSLLQSPSVITIAMTSQKNLKTQLSLHQHFEWRGNILSVRHHVITEFDCFRTIELIPLTMVHQPAATVGIEQTAPGGAVLGCKPLIKPTLSEKFTLFH